MRILLADDNPDDIRLAQVLLGPDWQVTAAATVDDARAALKAAAKSKAKFDVVLADLGIDGQRGNEVVYWAYCHFTPAALWSGTLAPVRGKFISKDLLLDAEKFRQTIAELIQPK